MQQKGHSQRRNDAREPLEVLIYDEFRSFRQRLPCHTKSRVPGNVRHTNEEPREDEETIHCYISSIGYTHGDSVSFSVGHVTGDETETMEEKDPQTEQRSEHIQVVKVHVLSNASNTFASMCVDSSLPVKVCMISHPIQVFRTSSRRRRRPTLPVPLQGCITSIEQVFRSHRREMVSPVQSSPEDTTHHQTSRVLLGVSTLEKLEFSILYYVLNHSVLSTQILSYMTSEPPKWGSMPLQSSADFPLGVPSRAKINSIRK
eukprot:gb/GECG01004151.1/.p1 GENE.gb/GECG01004151.1/~~gb/GECG01004151.1/.p1  ORF type:complete len:259 (+),score=18.86 gb/GECG01004151.1/:1-777(+)